MGTEIDYPLEYTTSGDTLFRDTGSHAGRAISSYILFNTAAAQD